VFITFEGIGGAGKTTQAELLRQRLARDGREVVLAREPGGTLLGEELRRLLLGEARIGAWAETALFAAARAELVDEVLAPALEGGADVICDRYVDSSLAYQGIARGLGVDEVLSWNRPAIRGFLPDRTFLLVVDVEAAQARREKTDRIDRGDREFARTLDRAYRALADRFPDRIVAVDASGPAEAVADQIYGRVRELSRAG
jgi:dTMP kinase